MSEETVTRAVVPDTERMDFFSGIFGYNFPLKVEPVIYRMCERLSKDYKGGFWKFYVLGNGGAYMAPETSRPFHVTAENYFEGDLSADALGIVACLYTFSQLSFGGDELAETCAEYYHLLLEYAGQHKEAAAIWGAID